MALYSLIVLICPLRIYSLIHSRVLCDVWTDAYRRLLGTFGRDR